MYGFAWMIVSNYCDAYMMISCYEASIYIYIYFSIVFYPCAVSYAIEFLRCLFYPDYCPWLPGTPFSALFSCFGAGVMGGRHTVVEA